MLQNKELPVVIIVVSYNTKELTRRALQAIFRAATQPAQVIVVDNNSQDGSQAMIKDEFPQVRLMALDQNLGFAKANNLALKSGLNQPYVWLLNSDTEIGSQTLEQLYAYAEANKKVGALAPQLIYPDGSWQSVGGFFPSVSNVFFQLFPVTRLLPQSWRQKLSLIATYPKKLEQPMALDYGTGAALFLRQTALDQAGLLGEDYFMYFEETDLCWRLGQAGWGVEAVPTDPVIHIYGGSFRSQRDLRRLKFFLQSLKLFVQKNYSGLKKNIILAELSLFGKISLWLKQL